jgi:1,2-dihydroxy-3-keto-5-methylthiopentene dioxygenase
MHAYLLDQPDIALSADALAAEGILYWKLPSDPEAYAQPLQAIRDARGYVEMDQIYLGATTPDLDGLCARFFLEHLHTDEEIRFVVDGAGIFDLRDVNDAWMRVHVEAGDVIIVPANKYHRFTLDGQRTITCKRLFQDNSGWTPINRVQS